MNEAEIVKLVTEQTSDTGSNTGNYIGFIILGGLYIIKTLWQANQAKIKDPDGPNHREMTRAAIYKIENRQTDIMEDIADVKYRIRHIEKLMENK